MKKPKLCEILGVEINEPFEVNGYNREFYVNELGQFHDTGNRSYPENSMDTGSTYYVLTRCIQDPELIIHKNRWTQQDIDDAKAVKRMFRNAECMFRVYEQGKNRIVVNGDGERELDQLFYIDDECFPSLEKWNIVYLEEILKQEA